jgi:GNAT superfamily N-acetyltransferase
MSNIHISFMEQNDIHKSAKVLSIAMLNNPHHIGVFLGNGENERLEIEKMFFELFNNLPGIVFLATENEEIIGVMRMKSCIGKTIENPDVFEDENDINWRKYVWFKEWAEHDPVEQHWHLGPIGVLPSHRGLGIGTVLMQRFCKEMDIKYVFRKPKFPLVLKKKWTKLELIRLYNSRRNNADENIYSEKSLSAKRFDKILSDITNLLKTN